MGGLEDEAGALLADDAQQVHLATVLPRAPLLQLARPRHRPGDQRPLVLGQERRERLVGQQGQEGLVLREPAPQRVHEDGGARLVGTEEGAHLALALHQLRQHRAAVHDVDGLAPGQEPAVSQLQVPRIGQEAPRPAGGDGLPQDLLVGERLHLRPVDDGHGEGRAGPAGAGAEDGLDEGGDAGTVRDGVLHRKGAEDGKLLEQPGHAVAVAEAGGGVAVDLDEPRAGRTQERVEARQHDVRQARVEADPARLGLGRAEERAQAAGVAVEGAPGDARRQLQQAPPILVETPPLRAGHEVRAQERAHRPAVEGDPGRGERVLEPRHLLERGGFVRGQEPVVLGDGI